ncbi:MAG: hypothetical protein DHS20C15_06160 [Planctomycetota bacterium]|nr:MAG: hypothetical protein DHS20C15_06160 [Planctomycetota bacterium]
MTDNDREAGRDEGQEAALLIHARALESLRRSQADLAAELAQGRELRAGLTRLDVVLSELSQGQERLTEELGATRRRLLASQRLLVALVLLGAVGFGAWWWIDNSGPSGHAAPRNGASAAGLVGAGAPESAQTRAVGNAALVEGSSDPTSDAAHSNPTQLQAALAERDEAARRLAEFSRLSDERAAKQNAQLDKLRKERNDYIGEAASLRADLVRAEQRFASLHEAGFGKPPAPPPSAPVTQRTTEREGPRELLALNAAFETLEMDLIRVLEIGASSEGGIDALMVNRFDPELAREFVEFWLRAELVEFEQGLALRLHGQDADPDAELLLPLSAEHPEVFQRTPLEVPARIVRRARARRALEVLLTGRGLELVSLEDVIDGELIGVQLRALGSSAELPGLLDAARGSVLKDGPSLLLREGTLTREGVTRPFWRDEWRRPLPGADFDAWTRALESLP